MIGHGYIPQHNPVVVIFKMELLYNYTHTQNCRIPWVVWVEHMLKKKGCMCPSQLPRPKITYCLQGTPVGEKGPHLFRASRQDLNQGPKWKRTRQTWDVRTENVNFTNHWQIVSDWLEMNAGLSTSLWRSPFGFRQCHCSARAKDIQDL